jgi:hypothetical protein
MKNDQFEEWWITFVQNLYGFDHAYGLVKEAAEKAWDNGFDAGWNDCHDAYGLDLE